MSDAMELTVRLSAETKDRLAKLAEYRRRDQSVLGSEAISDYVTRELATIEAIEAARADVHAGRVTPHRTVMESARAAVEAARADR